MPSPTTDAGATYKQPAVGSGAVVSTNHPLASSAGVEMLAAGGNAVDAAVASLFTLTVVEPMMVGVLGAGWSLVRFPDGRLEALDGYASSPADAHETMYTPISDKWPDYMQAEGRANVVGPLAVSVPGSLLAWSQMLERAGRLELSDVMGPAIRYARDGFIVSEYLHGQITKQADDLYADPGTRALFMPDGAPLPTGSRLLQPEMADSLATISAEGAGALYGGGLGDVVVSEIRRAGGILGVHDLRDYRTSWSAPLTGTYRGYDVHVPPLPSSGGVHLLQILALLEGFDLGSEGFGTAEGVHLLAEAFEIAFADRTEYFAGTDSPPTLAPWLISAEYATERRAGISRGVRGRQGAGILPGPESAHTTHVTTADSDGLVVSTTQTINNAFGARFIVPGTGLMPNNNMALFDPHPGMPNSVSADRRIMSSMSPTIVTRRGRPEFALGTPGGVRIFPAVAQAIINVIDHGMSLQQAVEAPRVWTQGQNLELEQGVAEGTRRGLENLGHKPVRVDTVAGGMNGIGFDADAGRLTGVACWRADGTPMAVAGGPARAGVRFSPTVDD